MTNSKINEKVLTFKGTLEGGQETVVLPTFDKHTFNGKNDNLVAHFPFEFKPDISVKFNAKLEKEVNYVATKDLEINGNKLRYIFLATYKNGIKHTRFGDKKGMVKDGNESCSLGVVNADGTIKKYVALYVNAGALIAILRALTGGIDSRGFRKADNIYKSLTLREDKSKTGSIASVENFSLDIKL